jgi:hypothetical protein
MRALALAVVILPSLAWAQQTDAPPEPPEDSLSVEAPPPPQQKPAQPQSQPQPGVVPRAQSPARRYLAKVRAHVPSPEWTQDRSFTSTRFWLLDPGTYEVETWLRTRVPHEIAGLRGTTEYLWQHEIEIGLFPHLQIDLYENLIHDDATPLKQEGVQIEARIAIPDHYGQMPLNPVVYLEFHPRHADPDRAEVRLLLGGAPTHWLYLVANPYFETNIEPTPGKLRFVMDAELGTTLAAGFRITDGLRLSAEAKIGGDMLGDVTNKLHFVWFLGPGVIWKPLPRAYRRYFKIMATCLFAMPGTDVNAQEFEPLVILGSQW